MAQHRIAYFGAALVILAACGSAVDVRTEAPRGAFSDPGIVERAGDCDANGGKFSLASAKTLFGLGAIWSRSADIMVSSSALTQRGTISAFLPGETLPPPIAAGEPISLSEGIASRLNAAPLDAVEYLVGSLTEGQSDAEYSAAFLAAVGKSGEVAFYGLCEYLILTRPLEGFARLQAISPVKALEHILADPTGATATAFYANGGYPPPVKWSDHPSDARSVGPGDTPQNILDRLSAQMVNVSAPADWIPTTWFICAKSSEGWGDCADIARKSSLSDPDSDTLTLQVLIYFDPGQGYDLVLKDGAGFDARTRPLLTINADTAAQQDSVRVVLSGTIDAPKATVVV